MNDPQRILVIDDSDFDQAMMTALLEKNGYQVKSLFSGNRIIETIQEYRPHLMLLDINIPESSGEKILAEIRGRWNSIDLPVIMVSGEKESTKIVQMLKAGANDYVTKPVGSDVTLARIETQLKVCALNAELSKLKERDTIQSMVATYNHEINNPLSIAISSMQMLKQDPSNQKRMEALERSLGRIAEITQKIKELQDHPQMEKTSFGDGVSKLYKIK